MSLLLSDDTLPPCYWCELSTLQKRQAATLVKGCSMQWMSKWVEWEAKTLSLEFDIKFQKNRVYLWKWKWHQSIVVPMQGWCDPWSIWWHYWLIIKISTSMVEVNHNVSKKENTISLSGDSTLYKLWLESTRVYTFSQNIRQSVIS